jgi:hypothetical protein
VTVFLRCATCGHGEKVHTEYLCDDCLSYHHEFQDAIGIIEKPKEGSFVLHKYVPDNLRYVEEMAKERGLNL